jgi:diguanylate cyclase (GGDEF)-like protein
LGGGEGKFQVADISLKTTYKEFRPGRLTTATDAEPSNRQEEIEHQFKSLSARDLQLWSIILLVLVVVGAGVVALVLPNILWHPKLVQAEGRYVPQLFFGFISLILLFNVYVLTQRRELNLTRSNLIHELVINQRLQSVSMIDPITQLLSRRALDEFLGREVSRANRRGTALTLLMVNIKNLEVIKRRLGDTQGDGLLADIAQVVKDNFRGCDLVFRYSDQEFLVLLPDTTEPQAECALTRLLRTVDNWNVEVPSDCEVSLHWGLASHVIGARISDVLDTAQRKAAGPRQTAIAAF